MIGFSTQRLMELEVRGLTGASHGERTPERITHRNGHRAGQPEHFGPALKLPWSKLVAPDLSATLIDRLVEGTQAQAGGRSIRELERYRDNCLIAILNAIEQTRKAHA